MKYIKKFEDIDDFGDHPKFISAIKYIENECDLLKHLNGYNGYTYEDMFKPNEIHFFFDNIQNAKNLINYVMTRNFNCEIKSQTYGTLNNDIVVTIKVSDEEIDELSNVNKYNL